MSSARFFSLKSKLTNISASLSEKIKLPEKFKGTFVEKWGIYWKSLMNDYVDVAIGTVKTSKEKPIRTSIIGGVGLFTYLCAHNNPDERDLKEAIRKRNSEMILVHETSQRAESAEYLKLLERSMNHGTLRILNLGVVTLIWLHDFPHDLCTYRAVCEYLQPELATFHNRIIDVGFWNKWWTLDKKMIDYDIVEE